MRLVISHKGLRKLHEDGVTRYVMQKHVRRLLALLGQMSAAEKHSDVDIQGNGYHPLSKDLTGRYAIKVDKNWRLHFFQRFEEDGVTPYFDLIEYEDYH